MSNAQSQGKLEQKCTAPPGSDKDTLCKKAGDVGSRESLLTIEWREPIGLGSRRPIASGEMLWRTGPGKRQGEQESRVDLFEKYRAQLALS
jgi:hypothetical protein